MKNGVFKLILFLLMGCILILLSYYIIYLPFIFKPEISLVHFIHMEFVLPNGGVILENTNKNIVLSESVGLSLLSSVLMDDKLNFDKTNTFIEKYLVADNGLLFWKINMRTKEPSLSSASIDDIRVIRARLIAYEKWNERIYLDQALALANAVKTQEIRDNYLVDSCSWEETEVQSSKVNLSYLDLLSLKHIAQYDEEWYPIFEKAKDVLQKGQMKSGLFYEDFDITKNEYSYNHGNMINQILCSVHLAEIGSSEEEFFLFLKKSFKQHKKIYNAYTPEGLVKDANESIANYALAGRLFLSLRNKNFKRNMYDKILLYQNKNAYNENYGGFGFHTYLSEDPYNSFDNFQVLLFLLLRKREIYEKYWESS